MKYLVLGVKKFDFTNSDTGEVVKGMNITVIDTLSVDDEVERKGILPLKLKSPDTSLFDSFSVLPGMYEIDFNMRPDAKGNPVIVLTGATLISEVKFTETSAKQQKAS